MTRTPRPDPLVARGPGELLTLVPHLFGFHPSDSLVVLEVLAPGPGGRRRLGFGARADLPVSAGPEDVAAAADPLLEVVRRRAGTGSQVHVLLHDPDARVDDGALVPGARARATLEHVLTVLGRPPSAAPAEVLLVTDDRWRSLTCRRPCCPAAGVPRTGAGALEVVAEAVGRGLTAVPGRAASLPETSGVDPARREAASRGRRAAFRAGVDTAELVASFDAAVGRRLRAKVLAPPDPRWCGWVLEGLRESAVRDAVLLSGGAGAATDRARAALLAGEPVGDLLDRALAEEGDPLRALAAAGLAVDVARHGTGPVAARAWAAAGWWEWRAGRGARAAACVEQALRHDPGHRLAALVHRALRHGLGPHG